MTSTNGSLKVIAEAINKNTAKIASALKRLEGINFRLDTKMTSKVKPERPISTGIQAAMGKLV